MGLLGLRSVVRVKKYKSYKGEVGQAAPDKVQRNFVAERRNQKWVTDLTEFKVGGAKLYLSPVLDLFNGEIIEFEINERPVFDIVSGMLKKALLHKAHDEELLLHSDQGWHYRMPAYQEMLSKANVVQSMSRKGNCLDNAAMESFFAVLKTEFFYPNKFENVDQFAERLREYIHYYNHDRIKMKLNGMSPVQYRVHAQMHN